MLCIVPERYYTIGKLPVFIFRWTGDTRLDSASRILISCVIFRRCSVKDLQTLGAAEIKLLYTLHWILLFASAECADEEAEAKKLAEQHPYLFSIPTVSVWPFAHVFSDHIGLELIDCLPFFAVVCLFVRSDCAPFERVRLSKLSAGEWHQTVAWHVGVQFTRCTVLYRRRQTEGTPATQQFDESARFTRCLLQS